MYCVSSYLKNQYIYPTVYFNHGSHQFLTDSWHKSVQQVRFTGTELMEREGDGEKQLVWKCDDEYFSSDVNNSTADRTIHSWSTMRAVAHCININFAEHCANVTIDSSVVTLPTRLLSLF